MPSSSSGEVTMDDTEENDGLSTTTKDPLDGHISPLICKDGIINNLEGLLNYIASGWKYHVSNTDGVKQAWSKFDNVTNKICSFMTVHSTNVYGEATVAPADFLRMPTMEHEISSADVFNAIVNRPPGPLDLPVMRGISLPYTKNAHNVLPSTSTTHRPMIIDVTLPFSSTAWFLSKISTLVGPPTNVRVEATSNSSAVVQWDFENGQVDGFVVKYMHEPGGRSDTERWTARTVMSPNSRHLEVPHLTAHKPYAFCVLAIKNNRQGACSDPPTLLERLTPTYMVQNLVVEWKTSNSVKLRWEYNGPTHVGFYLNHTGKKEYFDHTLAMKSMTTPGFKHELDEGSREYLWTNLRPYMQYTFHVGVRTLPPGARQYWPKEVVIVTDPTGPPFVFPPELDEIVASGAARPGQILVRLRPASEEYGPISHYWLIVVPGNYSKDDVVNMGSAELEAATIARRKALGRQLSVSPTKKVKKAISTHDSKVLTEHQPARHHVRTRRSIDMPSTAYIAARIEADEMRKMYSADRPFVVGDDKVYNGFNNFPLEPNTKYRLMMRSFAKADGRRKDEFDKRAPMGEKLTRLYSDSALTEPFTTRAALRAGGKPGGFWLIGPLIALLIIAILIGMLVCWWLRCNKKSAGRGHRHGSITKVALTGNIMNGIPGETSKLLSTDTYGRTVMNPYEQMNGHGNGHMESSMDLYPLPRSQSRAGAGNYAPVPVAVPCLPSGGGMMGSHLVTHPAVPISELAQHIERLRMNNNAGFQQEFESIETGQQFTWENSSAEMNKHKNRYANVVAYDHSRVVLSSLDGIPGTDYINANYIDGYDKPKAYIATQGPLPETFGDFWRMVWEEGSSTIVMLTNLEERSRIKCDQYWPSRGSSTYGEIQVTLLETTVLAHYTMRAFRIQVVGEMEMREIRHLQYTAWPDHGVPDHPTPFLIFLKRVKTLNPPDAGPIISHCSAGIGRTGAFIVVDCMLERLRYENTVDIFGCVTSLRSQRSYMVQTEDQYIFIHDAVLDAVNSGSTEVPAVKLRQHVMALQQMAPMEGAAGMELEFRHLSTLKWANTRCSVASLPANRHKNRPSAVVPYDSNRVIMQIIPGVEGSDYINASWVDGYRERGAYIATQAPTDQTVADFWRMVWEHDCAIIVMLTKTWEMGREKCCEYWPQETGAQVGQLVVEPIAEYNMREYILREFRLNDVQSGISRTVRHFQFTDWPEQGAPKTAETFLDLIQQVHRTKTQFGVDGPIVVHCSSGAGRTGVFVALAIIIDRMRLEHVVDVFTTVKLLRTERQNMVEDPEQYHFLYLAAIEFLASFEQYPTA
ncbi:Protein-tyrosine phosphatase [Oesophagostomum dentatum]|uniref:protein-tyrosine-phosphatase n=1 Tax=Oesophagostomum dentatum TaxID=61180 RepID=A0A0B1TQ74_OESDE|nr:Protein-tyrosine phosphatase [Oesophagostomum dentatum]